MQTSRQSRSGGRGLFGDDCRYNPTAVSEETAKSVLCLLPRLFDARISRRVDMLKQAGFRVEAVAFARDLDSGKAPDCPTTPLGRVRHGAYATRVAKLLSAVGKTRQAVRRSNLLYAFNADTALLALLAKRGLGKPLVQETADIRNIQVAGPWGALVRAVDRRIAERCSLLVLTTAGYVSYYRRWLGVETPALVLENKLPAAFAAEVRKANPPPLREAPAHGRPLRIGWFGILREPWNLQVLEALTRAAPQRFSAVLAGYFDLPMRKAGISEESFKQAVDNPNIEYRGPYSAPDDLPALYQSVDLVLDCYQPSIPVRWSQTNKYYEACLFGKPLIVRSGCADAEQVARHGIGLIIEGSSPQEAAKQIGNQSVEDWLSCRRNLHRLPPETYALINEAASLAEALHALASQAAKPASEPRAN